MKLVRLASERGHTRADGVARRHAFSAGDYHDARWMGWGALRVVDELVLAPGASFGAQRRANMEIFTFVLDGALRHRDDAGLERVVEAGAMEWIGAGHGTDVDPRNASATAPLRVLQAWIQPDRVNATAGRAQLPGVSRSAHGRWTVLASPDGVDGGAPIRQRAWLRAALLAAGDGVLLTLDAPRRYWIQVLRGAVTVDDDPLGAGDALGIVDEAAALQLAARDGLPAHLLVFDLPR